MTQHSRASLADPRQSFTKKDFAVLVAELSERVTGEPHRVVTVSRNYHYIIRYTHGFTKAGWA
jgi:hypothetical protein